eukprot:12884596-Prorocentrum_lima.AAC.1
MEVDGANSLKREGEDNTKVAAAKARLQNAGTGNGANSDAGSASSSFVNVPMDTLLASFRKVIQEEIGPISQHLQDLKIV